MKKIILLFLLLVIPFTLKASNLELGRESIHDDANIFSDVNEEKLNKLINRFELNSGIKFYLITIDENESISDKVNLIYENFKPKSFRLDNATLVLIYSSSQDYRLFQLSNRKYNSWDSDDLKKFENYHLKNIKKETLNENDIMTYLEEFNQFFLERNITNVIIISVISLLFTLVVLRKIFLKYDFPKVTEAIDYINVDKIKVK